MPDTPSTHALDGLAPIAGPDGTLAIVAIDQRNTLRRMLSAESRPTDADTISSFKVDVVQELSPAATAVLLDPEFGVPAVRDAGAMASGCATLVAVEPAERATWQGEPRAGRDPERTAEWVREIGGARTGRGAPASRTWWQRSSPSSRPWSTTAPRRASRR